MAQDEKATVVITYCIGCNWMLRAAWMAQELLSTFQAQLGGVMLVPGEIGGTFEIRVGEIVLWERKRDGGFPEAKDIKARLRDIINPDQDLGHIDRTS